MNLIKTRSIMYEQQIRYLPPDIDTNGSSEQILQQVFERFSAQLNDGDMVAGIVHDRDTNSEGQPVEPHVHIMLRFKNPRSLTSVAKAFGDKEQQFVNWSRHEGENAYGGSFKNGFAYLTHRTAKAQAAKKFQYDYADVVANFDYPAFMSELSAKVRESVSSPSGRAKIDGILDDIRAGVLTLDEAKKLLSGSEFATCARKLADVYALSLEDDYDRWREDMIENSRSVVVYWIFGKSGMGKTRYATTCARNKNTSYYKTGSNRDLWQNYKGQHAAIINELRPGVIPYNELLELLDPFGYGDELSNGVSAGSRYRDKQIAVDTVWITTPYSPYEFYCEAVPNSRGIDGIAQLYRRIDVVIEMTESEIRFFAPEEMAECGSSLPEPRKVCENTFMSLPGVRPSFEDSLALLEASIPPLSA